MEFLDELRMFGFQPFGPFPYTARPAAWLCLSLFYLKYNRLQSSSQRFASSFNLPQSSPPQRSIAVLLLPCPRSALIRARSFKVLGEQTCNASARSVPVLHPFCARTYRMCRPTILRAPMRSQKRWSTPLRITLPPLHSLQHRKPSLLALNCQHVTTRRRDLCPAPLVVLRQ